MRKESMKAAFCCAIALSLSAGAWAQSKVKIERDGYELKTKQEKNEFKLKEKGTAPMLRYEDEGDLTTSRRTTEWRQGQSTMTMKNGQTPEMQQKSTARATGKNVSGRHYAARKTCTCRTVAAKHKPMAKRSVAYRPKAKSRMASTTIQRTHVVAAMPVVVHDTLLVTRVDTVYSMMEQQSYAGYRHNTLPVSSDFKEMKIEKEDGQLNMKIEYEDGSKEKRSFPLDRELNLRLDSDMRGED